MAYTRERLLQCFGMTDWRQIQARIRKAKNSPDALYETFRTFPAHARRHGRLGTRRDRRKSRANPAKLRNGTRSRQNVFGAPNGRRKPKKHSRVSASRFRLQSTEAQPEPVDRSESLLRVEVTHPGAEETDDEDESEVPRDPLSRLPAKFPSLRMPRRSRERRIPPPLPTRRWELPRAILQREGSGAADGAEDEGRRRKDVAALHRYQRRLSPNHCNRSLRRRAEVSARCRSGTRAASSDVRAPRCVERRRLSRFDPRRSRCLASACSAIASERTAHGRAGDPALASRMAQLESMLRRLLSSPLHRLDDVDQAPAGPGVFLLSDSDQVTSYYVEACQTLRVGLGNLLRGGRSSEEQQSRRQKLLRERIEEQVGRASRNQ